MLAAGVGLFGVAVHGMTNVDSTLQIAAATPAPLEQPSLQQDVSQQWHGRDCDRQRDQERHHPEV
ncbi:hypothetical protein [Solirubrobacter ginsenosidimutans]|nr:hypothetical protein [Solirubrobacter ginsenosidimutans]